MVLVIAMKRHLETLLKNLQVYHPWNTEANIIGKWRYLSFSVLK